MALKLKGSTSGFTAIDAPAVAGDNTLVLPGGNGTSGQYLQTDGAGGLSWQTVTDTDTTGWTWDDTGTSLSGNSTVSITGIPSTARMIILDLEDASFNDAQSGADMWVRLGISSGLVSTNYDVFAGYVDGVAGGSAMKRTTAFQGYATGTNSHVWDGHFTFTRLSANVWYGEGYFTAPGSTSYHYLYGSVNLGGTLDRVGLLSNSATTFDSGTAYVHYLEP